MASKRQKKSDNPYYKSYKRERSRIQRRVKALESRGYIFSGNILPPIPKTINAGSVRRLQKITLDKIYSKAEYTDVEYEEILTGKQGRKREQTISAYKAANTRRRNAGALSWEQIRVIEDDRNKQQLAETEFANMFNHAVVLEQAIQGVLDQNREQSPEMVNRIERVLAEQLAQEPNMYTRLAQDESILNDLTNTFADSKGLRRIDMTSFATFEAKIKNRALTLQETQEIGNAYEDDEAKSTATDYSNMPFDLNE